MSRFLPVVSSLAVVLLAASALPGPARAQSFTDRARKDNPVVRPAADQAMAAAMAAAKADLPGFLAVADSPRPGQRGFAVKVGLRDPGGDTTEYFWLTPFAHRGEDFVGILNNTPRAVRSVQAGQRVAFRQADIVDWMFIDETGTMRGNRTACALLEGEGEASREQFRRAYGLDCTRNGL